jgi:hemerythrin
MSVMHWSVSYYTGLPEVDRQHEALFGLGQSPV